MIVARRSVHQAVAPKAYAFRVRTPNFQQPTAASTRADEQEPAGERLTAACTRSRKQRQIFSANVKSISLWNYAARLYHM